MKNLSELRTDYMRIKGQMTDLVNRAKSENRDLTDEENAQFLKMHEDQEAIQRAIDVQERIEQMEEQRQQEDARGLLGDANKGPGSKEEQQKRHAQAFWAYIQRGAAELSQEHRSVLNQYRGTNTITTTTSGTTYGGYTVPVDFSNELERVMQEFGGMLQAARIVNTRTGGQLDWPKLDDTGTAGLWTAEAAASTVQDLTFTREQFASYTLRTLAKLSLEFIQDESVDLVSGELASIFGERLGRALNLAFTTGDGSGKPTGVVTSATTGETTAAVAALTRVEILNLIHSVDPAYRRGPNVRLMMNDATLASIKQLSIGSADDRPLWVPRMQDGAPSTIEGFPYVINQDMASMGASNKFMAFGDFSKYIIRRVQDFNMVRLNELYMENLSVGFTAWARYDGKLLNTNAIKVMANAAS